ncbi:low temperature requirement protein A [Cellulomonas sp. H30R-01]|uniref:low temperature requirement protein A n=1 Tax=Cellulomonas sp. H30R-01 TaxID=2704467 RepID=UPI00138CD0DC|nr:low temperature requirement protein A [Cellulomonas sp. H30R-01]QHT56430.1 low temperature requirement protein A [Cellulomonas sp. H30R-01]
MTPAGHRDLGSTEPADGPGGATPVADGVAVERHASWLELFFDLVAVAGIGALAHLLAHERTGVGLGVYVLAFAAFWLVWACFTTYADIAGETTRTVTMLAGMLALGVMTAAVPGIEGEHQRAFAVAYVVGRVVASRPWRRASVVVDLPLVQTGAGVLPWVVSWWVEGPAVYALWAVGLALDLGVLLASTRSRVLASAQARLDRAIAAWQRRRDERHDRRGHPSGDRAAGARRARGARPDAPRPGGPRVGRDGERGPGRREVPTTLQVLGADVPHLGERMSLFVLIVLGESLIQVIDGASEAEWGRTLAVAGLGAFALLVGLWAVAVRWGSAGVALLPPGSLEPRLAWAAHLVSTCALAAVAATLAPFVAEPHALVPDRDRWFAVGAYATYALVAASIHVALAVRDGRAGAGPDQRRASAQRAVAIGAPALVVVTLAGVHVAPPAVRLVWLLAGGVVLMPALLGVLRRRDERQRALAPHVT